MCTIIPHQQLHQQLTSGLYDNCGYQNKIFQLDKSLLHVLLLKLVKNTYFSNLKLSFFYIFFVYLIFQTIYICISILKTVLNHNLN